jgi:hypothetical protein
MAGGTEDKRVRRREMEWMGGWVFFFWVKRWRKVPPYVGIRSSELSCESFDNPVPSRQGWSVQSDKAQAPREGLFSGHKYLNK